MIDAADIDALLEQMHVPLQSERAADLRARIADRIDELVRSSGCDPTEVCLSVSADESELDVTVGRPGASERGG